MTVTNTLSNLSSPQKDALCYYLDRGATAESGKFTSGYKRWRTTESLHCRGLIIFGPGSNLILGLRAQLTPEGEHLARRIATRTGRPIPQPFAVRT